MVEISRYLRTKGLAGKIKADEYIFDTCPFCKKLKKSSMSLTTGLFFCQRMSCESKSISPTGKGMNFYQFQKHFGDEPEFSSNLYFKTNRTKTAKMPADKLVDLSVANRKYLHDRKISDEIIDAYKLKQRGENEIAFPYYDDEKIVFIKYRLRVTKPEEEKCKASQGAEGGFFGKQFVSLEKDSIIITEGEIDALSMVQYGFENVVSVPNGAAATNWIEREWFFLHQFKVIYLCFDNDQPGQAPIADIAKRLSDHICKRVLLPRKDANQCLAEGVSEKEINEAVFGSEPVFKMGYADGAEDLDEAISNYKDPFMNKGIPFGIDLFDECLHGCRPREVTIIGGHGGVGKTTLMLQLLRNFSKQKQITTLISLEMEWIDLLEWIFEQNGLTPESPTEKFEAIRNGLKSWVRVVKPDKVNDETYILSMLELSARVDGVRYFILDNLTMMDMGQDDFDRIKQFIINCMKFVKKYNAHLLILAHNRKAGKGEDGTPTIDSILGSGNITRLASNVILMYNKKKKADERRITIFDIVKHRKHGKLGKAEFQMVGGKIFIRAEPEYKDDSAKRQGEKDSDEFEYI